MTEEAPLVTVGIPTRNRPESLRRAMGCITAQSWRRLEILVSDNASEGGQTHALMQDLCAADERIRFVRQAQNLGAFGNFEFLVRSAQGEYFLWFADDDLCEPDFIAALMELMTSDPQRALACCNVRVVDEDDRELRVERLEALYPDQDWPRARRRFFEYPVSNVFFAIYGMFRTRDLQARGNWLRPGWKGLETNTELPLLAWISTLGEIRAVPRVLKTYRIHGDSVYAREAEGLSRVDALRIKLHVRRQLLAIQRGARLDAKVKLSLLAATVLPRVGALLSRRRS